MADLAALFSGIEALVKSDATAGDAFSRAIDLCAAQTPHDDWERFRELDVEADLAELSLWLESLLEAQPPPPEASGLWFGLFNPVRGGVATADLHLAGAP